MSEGQRQIQGVSLLPCITCSPTNTSIFCCVRYSTLSIPSHLFPLFQWNPSLCDKKLKRRQLPPWTLMCSRNNSSQSRPELQSVLGVPVRQNPCSGVLYKVSRAAAAADVCGNSRYFGTSIESVSDDKFWYFPVSKALCCCEFERLCCCFACFLPHYRWNKSQDYSVINSH